MPWSPCHSMLITHLSCSNHNPDTNHKLSMQYQYQAVYVRASGHPSSTIITVFVFVCLIISSLFNGRSHPQNPHRVVTLFTVQCCYWLTSILCQNFLLFFKPHPPWEWQQQTYVPRNNDIYYSILINISFNETWQDAKHHDSPPHSSRDKTNIIINWSICTNVRTRKS